jgi:hypothetical protein
VALFLILILIVNTLGQLTRIRCIADAALLPVLVLHELALEVESMINV